MSEKTFPSRFVCKHDTEENWKKATNFSPKQAELIIYDIDENHSYERFKIGDGTTNVNDLPFADETAVAAVTLHTQNTTIHHSHSNKTVLDLIDSEKTAAWDNAVEHISDTVKHIPPGGTSGQILRWSADGEAIWGNEGAGVHVGTDAPTGSETVWIDTDDVSTPSSGISHNDLINKNDPVGQHTIEAISGLQSELDRIEGIANTAVTDHGSLANRNTANQHSIDAITGLQDRLKNAVAYNLLDNSDFTNPINQRGQTSYSGNSYSIDRWRAYHSDTVHTVTNNGITVSGTTNANMYQVLDSSIIEINKTYTCAAQDIDGNIYINVCVPSEQSASGNIIVYISNNKPLFRLSKATTWVWAALYEGEYNAETLPPYIPKGYAEELAKCQRYFISYGETGANQHISYVMAATTSVANGIIFLPTNMRIPNPTITYTGTIYLRHGATDIAVASIGLNGNTQNCCYFNCTGSSNLVAGDMYVLRLFNGAKINFSADL